MEPSRLEQITCMQNVRGRALHIGNSETIAGGSLITLTP